MNDLQLQCVGLVRGGCSVSAKLIHGGSDVLIGVKRRKEEGRRARDDSVVCVTAALGGCLAAGRLNQERRQYIGGSDVLTVKTKKKREGKEEKKLCFDVWLQREDIVQHQQDGLTGGGRMASLDFVNRTEAVGRQKHGRTREQKVHYAMPPDSETVSKRGQNRLL